MSKKGDKQMKQTTGETWTTVISSRGDHWWNGMGEVWEYRTLIKTLVMRNLKTMYAQTVLGPIWLVISAVLSSSVMTLVFGTIAGISTDGIPQFLFYLSGNILWMNFSGCVTGCADSLLSHAGLMGKVYFPRLCAPISVVLSRQFQFLVQTCIFFVVYVVLLGQGGNWGPTWWVLATPLLVIQLLALATGTGLILAAATVRYRDIRVLVTFGLQIWMYATPVVYPASQIQAQWRWLYLLNPVAPVVECFRGAWFGTGTASLSAICISVGMTVLILVLGLWMFHRAQRKFIDTI